MNVGRFFATVAAAWLMQGIVPLHAAVRTDGSVGPKRNLLGPNYTIGPDLGRQRGGNLFHSFGAFDLAKGESATFAGPGSVRDVIVRVTGGRASSIDGTLSCSIRGADLYLV